MPKKQKGDFDELFDEEIEEQEEEFVDDSHLVFTCPKDGQISRNDVVFLCNHCEKGELIYRDGAYMCPACLKPGQNFQCMLCDSKEVKLKIKE